ncbi:hypothetical protein LGN00_22070 [Burkholderia cepacia]|nr:hypothetical protein [Burkholderia cepacia]MCA8162332.1 hypothetical protein [Burkholderia cepacia]
MIHKTWSKKKAGYSPVIQYLAAHLKGYGKKKYCRFDAQDANSCVGRNRDSRIGHADDFGEPLQAIDHGNQDVLAAARLETAVARNDARRGSDQTDQTKTLGVSMKTI